MHWNTAPALEVAVDAFAFSNDDLELSAAGTYRIDEAGAAWADVNASLARADAAAVHRYVPLGAGSGAREWLRAALREGRLSAGVVKLRGRLDAFPFVARGSGFPHSTSPVPEVPPDLWRPGRWCSAGCKRLATD